MNLTWDSDNKLRSADIDANGTADVNFQYDALGRRVARTGTGGSVDYVQMDQQTIADYQVLGYRTTTPTFRYVYASYIDEPVVRRTAGTGGTLVYFHRNHQYSVTTVTTSAGTIAERYAYTAYGQPTILDASASVLNSSAINNRYTFTGREWDATLGLHYFRARWMSPSAGRFLTRDPIGYFGSDFDLYEYVSSGPLVYVDPVGNFLTRPGDDDREHTKNKRKSTKEKHEKGRTTAKKNKGGEKGDERRRGNPNKRGGRMGGLGGVVGIWLCLEGTACAAEPPNDWRDPRFSTFCECNCDCEQCSVVEIVPHFWNLAGVPESYLPVRVNEYSPGAMSAEGCYAEEGIDDVEVTYVLGYTIYNTTYTVCSWGGSFFGIPNLTGSNPDCFCDPCGTSSGNH
jgi:RHS repeat-associated protein